LLLTLRLHDNKRKGAKYNIWNIFYMYHILPAPKSVSNFNSIVMNKCFSPMDIAARNLCFDILATLFSKHLTFSLNENLTPFSQFNDSNPITQAPDIYRYIMVIDQMYLQYGP